MNCFPIEIAQYAPGRLRRDGQCCGREAQCGRRTKINWNKDYSPHIAVVWLQVVHWALDKKASACGGYVMLLLFFKYQFYFLGYLCCMHSGIPYSQQ